MHVRRTREGVAVAAKGILMDRGATIGVHAGRTLLAFLVLPNLLFALLGRIWFIDRAWVNLDYLIVGAASIWLGNRVTALAVFLLICADLLFAFAPGYHLSIASVLGSATELLSIDPAYVLAQSMIMLVAAGTCTWLVSRSWTRVTRSAIVPAICLGMALLLAVADARFSGSRLFVSDTSLVVPNIAASTANHLRIALATRGGASADQPHKPMDGASAGLRERLDNAEPISRNVILVVVESLGTFADPELDALQLRALDRLTGNSRFTVRSSGHVQFEGSTVPGELRELCGIRVLTVHPDPDALPVADCLPARMQKAGYRTLAAHGFMGTFFSRNLWYPALGFDHIWFASDFNRQLEAPRRCGVAFHGICDRMAWQALVDHLRARQDQRNFIYWLTISTHLPVASPGEGVDRAICEAHPVTRTNANACHLVAWHNAMLSSIVDSLQAGMPGDTTIILVGDHAPPFIDARTRGLFDPRRVPYAVIAPRQQ